MTRKLSKARLQILSNIGKISLAHNKWTLYYDPKTDKYVAKDIKGVIVTMGTGPMGTGRIDLLCQMIARGVFS